MTPTPDHLAAVYPEVAAAGTLAAYLRAEAAAQGLPLEVVPAARDPLGLAEVASTTPGRQPLIVDAWRHERQWHVYGESRGRGSRIPLMMFEGRTRQLTEVPALAVAWRDGASLPEVARAAPFVTLTGRYEVPDDSAAHFVASQWAYLRKEAQDIDHPRYRELVEAAYAQPVLRGLFAFGSHRDLRFSTRLPRTDRWPTEPETPGALRVEWVRLRAPRHGDFTLLTGLEDAVLAEAATAEQIVADLVGRLPSGLGPAM